MMIMLHGEHDDDDKSGAIDKAVVCDDDGVDVQVTTCDGNVGYDDGDDHDTGFESTDLFPHLVL